MMRYDQRREAEADELERLRAARREVEIQVDDVPPSLNSFGSGNRWKFINEKKRWGRLLTAALEEVGMAPAKRVEVDGELTFPRRGRRDQGNYRFMLEKALGDTLTALSILEDDDWDRYSFGALGWRYEKGVSRTVLRLRPA